MTGRNEHHIEEATRIHKQELRDRRDRFAIAVLTGTPCTGSAAHDVAYAYEVADKCIEFTLDEKERKRRKKRRAAKRVYSRPKIDESSMYVPRPSQETLL